MESLVKNQKTENEGPTLWYAAPKKIFKKNDFDLLQKTLNTINANTTTEILSSPKWMLVQENGLNEMSYKLTSHLVYSVCDCLDSSIYKFLVSLQNESRAGNKKAYDVLRNMWNSIIGFYFNEKLANKTIIIDTVNKTVDALLNSTYLIFPNSEFFMMIDDFITGMRRRGDNIDFLSASLTGRFVNIKYNVDVAVSVSHQMDKNKYIFCPGFYFSNTEAGRSGVKILKCFLNPVYDTCSISDLKNKVNWVSHHRKDFKEKINFLFETIRTGQYHRLPIKEYANNLTSLSAVKFDFNFDYFQNHRAFRNSQDDNLNKKTERWVKKLQNLGISRDLQKSIIRDTLATGSKLNDRGKKFFDFYKSRNRSVFDLYMNICSIARNLSPFFQEKLERISTVFLETPFSYWEQNHGSEVSRFRKRPRNNI